MAMTLAANVKIAAVFLCITLFARVQSYRLTLNNEKQNDDEAASRVHFYDDAKYEKFR